MSGFIVRSLRLCSLLVVVALVLAACGAPTTTTPATGTAEPSTAASPATTAEASASPATAETATGGSSPRGQGIRVTTTNAPDENNPSDIARHKQLLEEFKKVRPDVEIEAHQGGFDKEAFTAKFAAGTMEDTYLVPFTEPQELIARGQAADITDLIKGWENFDSFNPEVLRIVQDQQGRIYGVPVGGYALGLLYNRKLFQEAGLDPNKPPTTWDEVREYAKKLTDPSKGRAGFAELSKGNQGGWHFTAWKYSFGGDLVQQKDGKWTATFNDENGVKALQTLKDMRWTDKSMTEQQLLTVGDVLPLLANEQVAMAVMAPDALRDMKNKFQAKIEDFGMAPLPQGGGNGTLAGGAAWLFNPKSSPEVLQAAFDWTVNRDFNLTAFEADLKSRQERGDLVGFPELPLFTGEFEQQRQAIVAKYANAPVENYKPYMEAKIQLRTEPPVKTQELYAVIDTAMQAVLTDQNADPKQVLDEAAQQFQTQVLDQIK
ncbi:MAG TPA: sugar ABC transporter substrate-binding protein [Herpetosiphonaceae bacterium]